MLFLFISSFVFWVDVFDVVFFYFYNGIGNLLILNFYCCWFVVEKSWSLGFVDVEYVWVVGDGCVEICFCVGDLFFLEFGVVYVFQIELCYDISRNVL